MSTRIRMAKFGKRNQPTYRIVVIDSRAKRSGRVIEQLGYYNPSPKIPEYKIDEERFKYWTSVGAQSSEAVEKLQKGKYQFVKYNPRQKNQAEEVVVEVVSKTPVETTPATPVTDKTEIISETSATPQKSTETESSADEVIVTEEAPAVTETVAEEPAVTEEPPAEEMAVTEESPAVVETVADVVEDEPKVEEPIIELETPAEEMAVTEQVSPIEAPAVNEKPTPIKKSKKIEEPVTTAEPAMMETEEK